MGVGAGVLLLAAAFLPIALAHAAACPASTSHTYFTNTFGSDANVPATCVPRLPAPISPITNFSPVGGAASCAKRDDEAARPAAVALADLRNVLRSTAGIGAPGSASDTGERIHP